MSLFFKKKKVEGGRRGNKFSKAIIIIGLMLFLVMLISYLLGN